MASSIILASGSPTRKKMLANAGVVFDIQTRDLDEQSLRNEMAANKKSPPNMALELAAAKARQVSAHFPKEVVIGADQILEHEGEVLGKVETQSQARTRLSSFRGSSHRLISAVVVVKSGEVLWQTFDTATISFRSFSEGFLDDYLKQVGTNILHSVACYELEGLGSRLISHIDGDYFTVLGMPLIPLLNYFSETEMISG